MNYEQLMYLHLLSIVPAFLIATWLLIRRKGTPNHRMLGKVYMVLILLSSAFSLFMPARVGPALLNHFGAIHILSVMAIYSVVVAWRAIRQKDIRRHKRAMIGLYVGGMLIAGGFAFMPGRVLHGWIFAGI